MEVLALLLFPVLILVALARIVSPKSKGRRLRLVMMLLVVPLLAFFLDEVIGQSYLHARCAVNGGLTVSGNVDAEGYFDPDEQTGCHYECLYALLDRNFRYYEADVRKPYAHFTAELGVHKFFLAHKQSNECAKGKLTHRDHVLRRIPEGMCVAYKLLQTPSSKYEVSMSNEKPIWSFLPRMYKEFSYVKDRESGTLVASYTSYWWWGGWLRNNSFSHNSATVCPTIGSIDADVRKVISAK